MQKIEEMLVKVKEKDFGYVGKTKFRDEVVLKFVENNVIETNSVADFILIMKDKAFTHVINSEPIELLNEYYRDISKYNEVHISSLSYQLTNSKYDSIEYFIEQSNVHNEQNAMQFDTVTFLVFMAFIEALREIEISLLNIKHIWKINEYNRKIS